MKAKLSFSARPGVHFVTKPRMCKFWSNLLDFWTTTVMDMDNEQIYRIILCLLREYRFKQYPDVGAKFIELDQRDDGDKLQSALQQLTGQRTVPNVIIGVYFSQSNYTYTFLPDTLLSFCIPYLLQVVKALGEEMKQSRPIDLEN